MSLAGCVDHLVFPSVLSADTSTSLIQSIRNGATDLFYELIRPHERNIYLTALAITGNHADAEESDKWAGQRQGGFKPFIPEKVRFGRAHWWLFRMNLLPTRPPHSRKNSLAFSLAANWSSVGTHWHLTAASFQALLDPYKISLPRKEMDR